MLQELLASNIAQNLQLVVQIAKEYTEQLGADKIIALLEGVNSYNGLYYYLGSYLAFSEDPEVPRLLKTSRQSVMRRCFLDESVSTSIESGRSIDAVICGDLGALQVHRGSCKDAANQGS